MKCTASLEDAQSNICHREKGTRMLNRVILIVAVASLTGGLALQARSIELEEPDSVRWTIPSELHDCAARVKGAERYAVYDKINPFYLRLDLDGDGRMDTALLIERKRDKKGGILVCFGNGKARVLFAGTNVDDVGGEPMDDLAFGTDVDMWGVYSGKAARFPELPPPPRQRGELLFFGKSEAWGRFIFWTGSRFITYQNGD